MRGARGGFGLEAAGPTQFCIDLWPGSSGGGGGGGPLSSLLQYNWLIVTLAMTISLLMSAP